MMEKKLGKSTLMMLMSLLAVTITACDRGGSGSSTSGTMEPPRDTGTPKSDTAPATPVPPAVTPPPASSGGTSGGASGSAAGDSSGASGTSGTSSQAMPDTYGSPSPSERSSGTSSLEKSVSSDAIITTKVKSALMNDSKIKGIDINVDTQKGEVVLSGLVDSRAQIEEAMKVATGIEGVKKVTNQLRSRSPQ